MASTKAIIKRELLVWTRNRAKVSLEDASKAADVPVGELLAWERGVDAPTLGQLRCLARKYKFPFAVFFLPQPPTDFAPLRDFRRMTGSSDKSMSANLAFQIRNANERRELALELHDDFREVPLTFPLKAKVSDNPEIVAESIRTFLAVTDDAQRKAAKQNRAFDFWRRLLEENGILVFVVSGPHNSVPLDEMRGFALARTELPVVVVNGKDYSQGGKCYTLLHELAHITLGESAISNGTGDSFSATTEERRVERFCDAVAAAVLMPRRLLLSFDAFRKTGERDWSDDDLLKLSRAIGVSREALILRFIAFGRATWDFYHSQRTRYKDEYQRGEEEKTIGEKKSIPIKRTVQLISWNGRGFTRLVLRSYYDRRITLNDVSGYLDAKVKHIPALEKAAFQALDR